MATDTELNDLLGEKPVPLWRRHLKWIVIGVAALAVLIFAWRWFAGGEEVRYATQTVQRGNLTVTVSATGKLAPTNQVQVGSELSGLVETVTVDVNDRVVRGQALAVLDTSRLDDAIAQSLAALNAAQATVSQNQATVSESRAQLARYEEVSRLSGGRVPAAVEMEQARAAVARAVANLRAAQANVASARAELSSNQTQRQKAVIRSPVNGVVLAREIEPGQTVAASFSAPVLFVIAEDLATMELQVSIDEADVGSVRDGQQASFTVDAFPGRTFPARITRVDLGSNLSAETSTSTSTSTTSQVVSYAATLSVSNPDLQLRPGMTATAEIVTTSRPNVLMVPNAALRFTPAGPQASSTGGITSALVPTRPRGSQSGSTATAGRGATQTVYVLGDDGEPRPIQVSTGETNGTMTEVAGGELRAGMNVITGQLSGDGQRRQASGERRQGGQGNASGQSGGQRGTGQ